MMIQIKTIQNDNFTAFEIHINLFIQELYADDSRNFLEIDIDIEANKAIITYEIIEIQKEQDYVIEDSNTNNVFCERRNLWCESPFCEKNCKL